MSPQMGVDEGWPKPGEFVLISTWPWGDLDGPDVYMAIFGFEGAHGRRPTFRALSGDSIKPTPYAWMSLPEPAPMPKEEAL